MLDEGAVPLRAQLVPDVGGAPDLQELSTGIQSWKTHTAVRIGRTPSKGAGVVVPTQAYKKLFWFSKSKVMMNTEV